ncbi:MAG: ribonuclease HI family protein [Acidimicrobiia bacterium]
MTQASLPFAGQSRTVSELILYCDGGSRGNPGPSAVGAVVYDAASHPPELLASVSECIGITTNNVAEYRALIAGLEAVAHLRARIVHVRADSLLMIKQLRGEYRVKNANLKPLHADASRLLAAYEIADLAHVPREENTEADALVNAALDAT